MRIPRILLTAPSSGSGKTLITCGILNLLKRRRIEVASFKSGPDFIDPMFHTTVIGTKSRNLDTFFTDPDTTCYLFEKHAAESQIAVMEGVMGFYDGVAGISTQASAYDVARITGTPAVLLVDAKGASVSIAALIKGFAEYRQDSPIAGVILNRLSPMMYSRMKELIEGETGVAVLGYVPVLKDCVLESRHLGLVLPGEVKQLQQKLDDLSEILEESLEVDKLLELAKSAGELTYDKEKVSTVQFGLTCEPKGMPSEKIMENHESEVNNGLQKAKKVRIGLAQDEAFCFFYKDNLELLEDLGAELVPFSPLHDERLPEELDGFMLHGGYPELYAEQLSGNRTMLDSIREAVESGLPAIAECGGFMYLHQEMEDMEGRAWPMAGVLEGRAFHTERLNRFGYITLEGAGAFGMETGPIPAHEFHYFDSTCCGDAFLAKKPLSKRSWRCVHSSLTLFAGFPHLYYYGNPRFAEAFIKRCEERGTR